METLSRDRVFRALSLENYKFNNPPVEVAYYPLFSLPKEEQKILRMIVKFQNSKMIIPEEIEWINPLIQLAIRHQEFMKVRHPFCYVTIRHGICDYVGDSAWHVDGFSMRYSHLPEQNYIWCSNDATEYLEQKFYFPNDFNPLEHDINSFFQGRVDEKCVRSLKNETLYCLDPYVVHRRPVHTQFNFRTFIRITFCQIEIKDILNTINPKIATYHIRDGVKEFRDALKPYAPKI